MQKPFDLSGPNFIGIYVRDVEKSAEFYEKVLSFRRDPEDFKGRAVGFLAYPTAFAVIKPPPDIDLDNVIRPIRVPLIWFKANDSQAVYDALVKAGVTILKEPSRRRGLEFTFLDPDGYAISIYDRDTQDT